MPQPAQQHRPVSLHTTRASTPTRKYTSGAELSATGMLTVPTLAALKARVQVAGRQLGLYW